MMPRRAQPGFTPVAGILAVVVAGLTGCAGGGGTALPAGSRSPSSGASSGVAAPRAVSSTAVSSTGTGTTSGAAAGVAVATPGGRTTAQQPMNAASPTARPLAGQVIALDPGHNGANWSHPAIINRLVNVITEWKACDTAGAQTDEIGRASCRERV